MNTLPLAIPEHISSALFSYYMYLFIYFCILALLSTRQYPSRCSAAKGAELDSAAAAAKQKGPFAAVWREAGAYII